MRVSESEPVDRSPILLDGIKRLKAVFLDIPGTRLTPSDAAKLSGLEQPVCEMILDVLEEARFLDRARDGRYHRRGSDSPN